MVLLYFRKFNFIAISLLVIEFYVIIRIDKVDTVTMNIKRYVEPTQ